MVGVGSTQPFTLQAPLYLQTQSVAGEALESGQGQACAHGPAVATTVQMRGRRGLLWPASKSSAGPCHLSVGCATTVGSCYPARPLSLAFPCWP